MILHKEIDELVGRDALLSGVFMDIKKEKHLLLTGGIGVGKSAIMEALYEGFRANGSKCLFIPQTNPMKSCILDMAEGLHARGDLNLYEYGSDKANAGMDWSKVKKVVGKLTVKDVCGIVLRSLQDAEKKQPSAGKYIIFLDHLERITPSQEAFFSELSHCSTFVGATDEKKSGKNLKRLWWSFKEIKIPELTDGDIKEIAGLYIEKAGLCIEDKELFLTTLAKEAKGSPLACANIFSEYRGEGVIRRAHIREFHADVGVRQVDMTPVFILAMAVVVASRFLALGLNDTSLYVLTGITYAGFMFLRFFIHKAFSK